MDVKQKLDGVIAERDINQNVTHGMPWWGIIIIILMLPIMIAVSVKMIFYVNTFPTLPTATDLAQLAPSDLAQLAPKSRKKESHDEGVVIIESGTMLCDNHVSRNYSPEGCLFLIYKDEHPIEAKLHYQIDPNRINIKKAKTMSINLSLSLDDHDSAKDYCMSIAVNGIKFPPFPLEGARKGVPRGGPFGNFVYLPIELNNATRYLKTNDNVITYRLQNRGITCSEPISNRGDWIIVKSADLEIGPNVAIDNTSVMRETKLSNKLIYKECLPANSFLKFPVTLGQYVKINAYTTNECNSRGWTNGVGEPKFSGPEGTTIPGTPTHPSGLAAPNVPLGGLVLAYSDRNRNKTEEIWQLINTECIGYWYNKGYYMQNIDIEDIRGNLHGHNSGYIYLMFNGFHESIVKNTGSIMVEFFGGYGKFSN